MRSAALALALATTALAACGDNSAAPDEATTAASGSADAPTTAASVDPLATESVAPDASASATASASPTPAASEAAKAGASTAAATPEPKKGAGLTPAAARAAANDRHEKYEELGRVNKAVFDELRKPSPDLALVRRNAGSIHDLSVQMINWFPAGSGPQDGIKTDSKANVWTDWNGFKQAHQRMVAQANNFATVAQGNDVDAIKSASRTLGAACKNCHDSYRAEDD